MPDYVTDLKRLAILAQEQRDDFEVLRYQLEAIDHVDDAAIDRWIEGIAAPIIAAIDCTQCANCCRRLDVYVTAEDAERLAEAGVAISAAIEHEAAQRVGEWGRIRGKPCPFLRGNLCVVYGQRPQSCRLYPQFTPDFRWVLGDMAEGAGLCPIIYNTLRAAWERIDELYSAAEDA